MSSRESTPEAAVLDKKNLKNECPLSPGSKHADERDIDEYANTHLFEINEALIDMDTFEQLLDMDDENDHEFSNELVTKYYEQAETTFKDMDVALEKKDLKELSRLGHFLKGSSAAIGLKKVKDTCEKIQNIGECKNEEGTDEIEKAEALKRIIPLLPQVKKEYEEAKECLKGIFVKLNTNE